MKWREWFGRFLDYEIEVKKDHRDLGGLEFQASFSLEELYQMFKDRLKDELSVTLLGPGTKVKLD